MTLRGIALAIALMASTPVDAAACHHFSHWYYPFPQRCGVARQMVRPVMQSVSASSAPNRERSANKATTPDIALPSLPSLAKADLVGGEADEPTRAKVLLRAALEAADARPLQ